jgi:hypothetical protein
MHELDKNLRKSMAPKNNKPASLAIPALIVMAILTAVVSGASFEVINYWPLPVSVAPYMGFQGGAVWGLVIGAITGLVIGFAVDDKHFEREEQ